MSQKKITKKELLVKAAEFGLKGVQKLKKDAIIHAIQVAEGNDACFSNIQNCAVSPCLYRAECQTS
ncbi:MAG: Rho termination factor N-terminal domain-containing protein [Mariprofundaceae bacterium]|nr:Rho termination factor N-terminal domain-containing protein [Mariprofundaceae bacterium]